MIIHLGARISNIHQEIDVLRSIITTLHDSGHALARNWIEPEYYRSLAPPAQRSQLDWTMICRESLAALKNADAAIFEVSDRSCFAVGYLTAVVLQAQKPVLLLSRQGSQPDGSFASGLDDPLVVFKEYRKNTVAEVVRSFLQSPELTYATALGGKSPLSGDATW